MEAYVATSNPLPINSYAEKVRRRAESLEGRQAAMKLAVSEELWMALERTGTSQAELARRVGTSPQYVAKVFRGTTNFTLESMVSLFYHVGYDLEFSARPKANTAIKACYFESGAVQPIGGMFKDFKRWVGTTPLKEKANDQALAA